MSCFCFHFFYFFIISCFSTSFPWYCLMYISSRDFFLWRFQDFCLTFSFLGHIFRLFDFIFDNFWFIFFFNFFSLWLLSRFWSFWSLCLGRFQLLFRKSSWRSSQCFFSNHWFNFLILWLDFLIYRLDLFSLFYDLRSLIVFRFRFLLYGRLLFFLFPFLNFTFLLDLLLLFLSLFLTFSFFISFLNNRFRRLLLLRLNDFLFFSRLRNWNLFYWFLFLRNFCRCLLNFLYFFMLIFRNNFFRFPLNRLLHL